MYDVNVFFLAMFCRTASHLTVSCNQCRDTILLWKLEDDYNEVPPASGGGGIIAFFFCFADVRNSDDAYTPCIF